VRRQREGSHLVPFSALEQVRDPDLFPDDAVDRAVASDEDPVQVLPSFRTPQLLDVRTGSGGEGGLTPDIVLRIRPGRTLRAERAMGLQRVGVEEGSLGHQDSLRGTNFDRSSSRRYWTSMNSSYSTRSIRASKISL